MEEALEFYDASTKKKFTASDWRLEVRQTDSGKVSYYAVADAPRSGKPTRRRVSADLAETRLIRQQRPTTAYQYAGLLGVQAPTLGVLIDTSDGVRVTQVVEDSPQWCAATCGNGTIEYPETCDDGETNDCTGTCNGTCSGPARFTSPCAMTMPTPGCSRSSVRKTCLHS